MAAEVDKDHPSEDEQLATRLSQGDRSAFLTLYDRYAGRVYGLTLRILRDAMSAEEATQDTFLKLWRKAASYNPAQGAFRTWLLTIARHTALDQIRRESRRPILETPDDPALMWGPLSPAGSESTEEARWRTLRFALRDLPAEQSQAIELAFFYGMSHSEIAEELRLPLGTVKTRIRLGMEKLRKVWFGETSLENQKSDPSPSDV